MRPAVALLVLLALGCGDRPPPAVAPADAEAIRDEVARAFGAVPRPALGTPVVGDAADDHAVVRAAVAELPAALDAKARLDHGRFGAGKPLPPALVEAATSPAAAALVAAIRRAAARTHATSPLSLRSPFTAEPALALVDVADVVLVVARARAAAGDRRGATAALIALARLGHDVARGAPLLGHAIGATIVARAATGLAERFADPAATAAELELVRASATTTRDALIGEARLRVAIAGLAAELPLGVAWRTLVERAAVDKMLVDWGAAGLARRALDELAAMRALPADAPPDVLLDDADAACHRIYGAGFVGCAGRAEPLAAIGRDLRALDEVAAALDARLSAAALAPPP
jgi:hypothetical protein